MEESIMKIMNIDEIWNNKRDNKYSWARMFYIYSHVFILKKTYNETLYKLISYNQFYYLTYRSKYLMNNNHFFKFQYSRVLYDIIKKSYSIKFEYEKKRTKRTKNLVV